MIEAYTVRTSPWFPSLKPGGAARLRLFCFPYAGGAAHIYRDWPAKLPAEIEVCPAQLPGRGSRRNEPCYTNLLRLAEGAATAILPYLDRPFAFFGHSMGALVSFELARELRRRGAPQPVHLLVSGRSGPQVPRRTPITYNLPEPLFIERLRQLNGTPKEVLEEPEMMQMMIPLLRADFEVSQTYTYEPEPPLDYPITAFGGLEDSHVTAEGLSAWREQTTAAFDARLLPGDHFFLQTAKATVLRMVAEELGRRIS